MQTMSDIEKPKTEPAIAAIPNVETVARGDLLGKVRELYEQKARFITATCLDLGDKLEVFYHFDKDLQMKHLRVLVGKDEEVPSISGVYFCAFLVENEMQEMFGLKIGGLVLDYKGRLLLTEECPKLPMLKADKSVEST
ncbi:MAG: NADH-quinone oxidoreductase subunit C [Chloroflexota bacterium]